MGDNKRKQPPGGSNGSAPKKSKGGVGSGKWKTPHQQAKLAKNVAIGKSLTVGDRGVWFTYARNMKYKAQREIVDLCEEYGETMYGIKRQSEPDEEDEDAHQDIEASIEQELSDLKPGKPKTGQTFVVVHADVECLMFVRMAQPIDPVEFVRKICQDARDCKDVMSRKTKYVNRLTPITDMAKATEKGLVQLATTVMAPHFVLNNGGEDLSEDPSTDADASAPGGEAANDTEPTTTKAAEPSGEAFRPTYAIRPSMRSHLTLNRDIVIKRVAELPGSSHKVNLTEPDKVILIDIYQMFCGMSVVDGVEWESLKRYNVNELYRMGAEKKTPGADLQAKEETTAST
ncbi:tRNA acetyltransferase-like protein [Emericellopsis cladophorae]|uniref:tRNA acetyltransferase-like protein n=1 Tax=Emericellopsis cladophorae TaxID=2686198 RepID=A0A9Q0BBT9_9HYPO|nr:tRNA acetyltransferase-like protein [Emericellopsis cladophorae]KAI6779662.1 tRNA acetyltransferase-like protein [Emericellopsis cladophorae]